LNLGVARADLGEDEAARRLFERALAITERALAPDHPQHVRALATLANLHFARGRFADAEPLYRRLLVLRDQGAPYDAWDQVAANWARLRLP
jgi:tetratricopeptide (TPR) repeat protein